MPDTGAPWNIPYVTSADLVSDWPADSLALANAIDAGLDAAGPAGIGSNVVQTVKTDTFTTTSTSFVTVTGLTVSITPTSTASKILIIAQISHGMANAASYGAFKVTRGGTDIYTGDTRGSRINAVFGGYCHASLQSVINGASIMYVDSPATTSPTTYQVEARKGTTGGGVFVNYSSADTDNADTVNGASSITVIEVAA